MRVLSFVLLALLLPGCASQALLAADYSALTEEVNLAHNLANCAPVDLALADSNMAFARLEFDQGNVARAADHVRVAREHAKVAGACAAPPPPKPKETVLVEEVVPLVDVPLDADRDGVVDKDDRCVRDPEDLDGFKDTDGCPELDNDLDGVVDQADRCIVDPEDRDGFMDDDGCPDPDNDSDGVADAQDACPNQQGSIAQGGCPVTDKDNDGVNDDADRCPTEPETRNEYLDDDGCPDARPQRVEITSEQIVIKQRINFATGKAVILKDSYPVLDDVALVLKDYPNLRVEIGGHTDNVGDDNGNQRLSKARADAVFEYLLSKGVVATRMSTVGYGETRPVDTNMTEAGRINNRRVEFLIQK